MFSVVHVLEPSWHTWALLRQLEILIQFSLKAWITEQNNFHIFYITVPLFSNCLSKLYILKSPFKFSLIDGIFYNWNFLLFLTPMLWFPAPPPLFSFYFVSLDNGVKEIDPYEGLYIKKDLFCAKNLLGGCANKNKPDCNWCLFTYIVFIQLNYFVSSF